MGSLFSAKWSDEQSRNNPSVGLKIWGPLTPANDCKGCLISLAGLQIGAGTLLCFKPSGKPPVSRGIWTHRLMRLACISNGIYLIFLAGTEFARLALLPYDPWVEDARVARQNADKDMLEPRSNWSPSTWRYNWFGPSSYRAVSTNEWRKRLMAYVEKAEKVRPHFDNMRRIQDNLSAKNMSIASDILTRIKTNQLPAPEIPVQELEVLSALPDVDDEEEFYDEIDLSNADLWEFFEEPQAFSVIVVPRSTQSFLPGVQIANEDGIKSQNVNYMPIPQAIKNGLR